MFCSIIFASCTNMTTVALVIRYMEKKSKIDWCINADEGENVIGTMFVQLPSKFSGGKVAIYKWEKEKDEL